MLRKLIRNRKGQGLVEYALIIAGVALICAAAIAIFGHKVNDMIAGTAAVLPGAHAEDNAPIYSGSIIEYGADAGGTLSLDLTTIEANSDGTIARLGSNVSTRGDFDGLVSD